MHDFVNGWLVLDKPLGMTSRAAVDRAMTWFPKKTPIGHTGTLDPLATGVLVLAVGRCTRLAEYVQELEKTYDAEFTLGATSATDDAEGPITPTAGARDPGRDAVEAALANFIGVTEQVPPAYSAAKVAGRRAYAAARSGTPVLLRSKPVRIDSITIKDYAYPRLRVEVVCGKGTYIRSLARDLCTKVGCGGYVSELRRTAVGPFTPKLATPIDAESSQLLPLTLGLDHLPRLEIRDPDVRRFRQGQTIILPFNTPAGEEVVCYDRTGRLVAIARRLENDRLQPHKVLWPWTESEPSA